jgi:arylsulfatase A-like enzyme
MISHASNQILRLAFLLVWGGLSQTLTAFPAPLPARPNFVIIMADDMGYGDSSVYDGWIRTPQLERLAREGLRFTDFHSSGHVCSPTRAGLLTGRYQQRAGIPGVVYADASKIQHYSGLQDQEITLAEELKKVGYNTALFGKWHLGYLKPFNPTRHGFDQFRGYVSGNVDYHSHEDNQEKHDWWHGDREIREPGYTTHLINRHAVDYIREQKENPFLLYIAHEAVHSPYQGPQDPIMRGPRKKKTPPKTRPIREIYRDMMMEMDRGIGEVLDVLTEQGLSTNTLVFFFSDNGANKNGSNSPWRGHKGTHWEGGHRVPAIAWWPSQIEPNSVTHQISISLDLMPTFLDLAGVAPSKERPLDGLSLRKVLLQGNQLGPRRLFWNGRAMREGDWKLIRQQNGLKGTGLFHLARDPGETNNLAIRHPERVQAMLRAMDQWQEDVERDKTIQPDAIPQPSQPREEPNHLSPAP